MLREADGAIAIRAFRQRYQSRSAVVVGGGVLGIEAADALRRLNLAVTIVHRGERLMDRQLDERGSAILKRYLEGLGINVLTNARAVRCIGTDRLRGIELADGTQIEAEIMVACAGIQPNIDIAKAAGLEVGRASSSIATCAPPIPTIFAVGDVAELSGSLSGLWAIGAAQGKAAAAALFGRTGSYGEPNTLVNLKMDGIDVKSFGLIGAKDPGQEMLVDNSSEDEHRVLVLQDGRWSAPSRSARPAPAAIWPT